MSGVSRTRLPWIRRLTRQFGTSTVSKLDPTGQFERRALSRRPVRWPAPRGEEMPGPEPTITGRQPTPYTPPAPQAIPAAPNTLLDSFSYDDDIVRKFLVATFIW